MSPFLPSRDHIRGFVYEVATDVSSRRRPATDGNNAAAEWVAARMELADALAFARQQRGAVLTTIRRDGRPQLSNVTHRVTDDGAIEVSITADRAKYANLRRDPRASVHVTSDDFRAYAVIDGDAELLPVAAAPDDATVDRLVELYRAIVGEHPDWDDYRAAMVRDRRTVVHIVPTHAYGYAITERPR